jgi:hypothetical protein
VLLHPATLAERTCSRVGRVAPMPDGQGGKQRVVLVLRLLQQQLD